MVEKAGKAEKVRKALTLRTFVYYQEAISVSSVAAVFHIDYRADKVQHLDRRLDKTQYLFGVFVSHWAFIESSAADRGAIHSAHRLLILSHINQLFCLAALKQAACAMRCREIPVGIAATLADDESVAHIERYAQLRPHEASTAPFRRTSSLPERDM